MDIARLSWPRMRCNLISASLSVRWIRDFRNSIHVCHSSALLGSGSVFLWSKLAHAATVQWDVMV